MTSLDASPEAKLPIRNTATPSSNEKQSKTDTEATTTIKAATQTQGEGKPAKQNQFSSNEQEDNEISTEDLGPISTEETEPKQKQKMPIKAATKRVVVLGAGMAGLLLAQQLRRKGLAVTLVSARDYFIFLPRLTELAAKTISEKKVVIQLREVWPGELHIERATLVNTDENTVILESGISIAYDVLAIAIGSETNFFGTPGANYAFPFYSREDTQRLYGHIDTMLDADVGTGGTHTFAIIGGGPTGVEVASILADKIKARRPNAKVMLVERGPNILGPWPQLAPDVRAVLEHKGVEVLTGAAVSNITPLSIELQRENQNKEAIPCYTTIWAAGSKPSSIVISGVSLSARGEVPSSETLQVPGHLNIFAIGDAAGTGKPKTAQAAVQQGQQAAENIVRFLAGKAGKPFEYKDRGVVIALESDTCGLFFGRKLKGFIAKTMRDTYYSFSISQYK